jgi:hypothetical protein
VTVLAESALWEEQVTRPWDGGATICAGDDLLLFGSLLPQLSPSADYAHFSDA